MSVGRVDKVSYSLSGFGAALTHDLVRGAPSAQAFFPTRGWQEAVSRIDQKTYQRTELCRILEREAARFSAPNAVLKNIARLGQAHTYVVATGQQAGFLGGPLFTLHKALTTIKLARQFEAAAGGRASFVPVFWVASDDHDIAEIDHAYLLNPNGEVARVRAPVSPDRLGQSACDVRMDSDPAKVDALKQELLKVLPEDTVERYLSLYLAHNFGDAFTALMYQWLGESGLVVVQSTDMRVFSGELLQRELDRYEVTGRLIGDAANAMQSAGYEPGFSNNARVAPHFFIASEPARIRAGLDPVDGGTGGFQERSPAFELRKQSPRTFSKQELSALIDSRPELFSTSAALRPVLQQRIFPVAAAVLGPGEIAYWAQLSKLHEHFDAVFPLIVPRATLTLVDGPGEKSMRKLGLPPGSPDLFLDAGALQKKVLKGGEAENKIMDRAARILAELEAMAADVHAIDAGLKPLFEKTHEKVAHELQRIAEKTRASVEQRDDAGAQRARYLSALIRPKNEPQERVLSMGQFLQRYPNLATDLESVIDPASHEHLVVTLEPS